MSVTAAPARKGRPLIPADQRDDMTITMTIRATTTDAELELIPYLDMRAEAAERRDDAAAVLSEQGDQVVLELHNIDGVDVLYSPEFAYSFVNKRTSGVGDSLLIGAGECDSPEHAARVWLGK